LGEGPNRATIDAGVDLNALTPTLSQREREKLKASFQSPRPLGEGQGEGHSCYDRASYMTFETASMPCPERHTRC